MQNPIIRTLTLAFVTILGLMSAVFWFMALTQDGPRAVLATLDVTVVTLAVMAHLPAMAGAILLWRAGVGQGNLLMRGALGVAMIYFSAACVIAFFGNFLAASILGMLS